MKKTVKLVSVKKINIFGYHRHKNGYEFQDIWI